MTTMHVANPTQQIHVFMYRVAENTNLIEHLIPPGGQVQLKARRGDLTSPDISAIVDQHAKYGLIAAADVGRTPGKIGLIYNLDRPVPFAKITEQILRNRGVMIEAGKRARQAAAVASSDNINDRLSQLTNSDVMQNLVVEVEQKTAARVVGEGYSNAELARQLADSPTIAEGIRIDENAPPQGKKPPRQRAPRRRS